MTRPRPPFVSTLAASVFFLAACQDITQPRVEQPVPSATVIPAATGTFAYVAHQGQVGVSTRVSVIETASNTVVGTINAGTLNWTVAITPDGGFAWVPNLSCNTVSVIETATNTVVATVIVAPVCSVPFDVAFSPDGGTAYVTNRGTKTLSVIEIATNTVVATVSLPDPRHIAITSDGRLVYVTNQVFPGAVSVIEAATNAVVATIPVGNVPMEVAITPDGRFAYVPARGVPSLENGTVVVIETATNTVSVTIPVPGVGPGVAITPDGGFAYTANFFARTVSVIEIATNTVVATVDVGNRPNSVAFTSDGAFAYVTNGGGSNRVDVIETASNTVVAGIPVGPNPRGVAITPLPASPREGCGPRFWRTHLRRWQWAGFHPGDDFDATFGTDFFDEGVTLRRVIRRRGRVGVEFIARVGTAALLNAGHPEVDYPLSVAEVIAAVQTRERAEAVRLAGFNEVGCPFSSSQPRRRNGR